MNDVLVKIYDTNRNLVAILQNATKVGYKLLAHEVGTAQFTLPANDPKNAIIQPFYFAEIIEADRQVGMFRIMPVDTERADVNTVTYNCEHVLSTLIDSILFRDNQVDNSPLAGVLGYILDNQRVKHWTLGTVDFTDEQTVNFENTNLLSAVLSAMKIIADDWYFDYDTTVYPWKLHVRKAATNEIKQIRYRRNLTGLHKRVDYSQLCTRLYALGNGEGVNQIDLTKVNGGKPYIDADTIGTYGIFESVYVNRDIEDAATLLKIAQATLEKVKTPPISYSVSCVDLSREVTTDSPEIERLNVGDAVRVYDDELGVDVITHVVSVEKPDIGGAPGDVQIELSNRMSDITSELADIADRLATQELHAQGATNLDSIQAADNCDSSHPFILKFYVPAEAKKINLALLSYSSEAFRGYSRATKGGGGTMKTTSSGGGTTQTTTSGGGTTQTTSSGGGTTQTSSSGGDHRHLVFKYDPNVSGAVNTHRFTDANGRLVDLAASPDDLYTAGSSGNHTHSVTIPNHTHSVTIPNHSHSVTIPDHTHTVTIPDHTHDIDYGIYEGPTPTSVTVKVDGHAISGLGTNEENVDIIPYLSTDSDGNITRDAWHTVTITPNGLGRINANLLLKIFVQSRGLYDL